MRTRLHLAVVLSVIALAGCGTTTSPVPVASICITARLGNLDASGRIASHPSPRRRWAPPVSPRWRHQSRSVTRPGDGVHDACPASSGRGMDGHPLAEVGPDRPVDARPLGPALAWRLDRRRVGCLLQSGLDLPGRGALGPLPFNTATTFRPDAFIVGVAEVRSGLVALTMLAGPNECSGGLDCRVYKPPLVSWTSPDGERWTPHGSPDLGGPAQWNGAPLLAAGPAGLVVTSGGNPSDSATSVDGIRWRALPTGALPTGFNIRDIVGTATGFTAVGSLPIDADHSRAVTLQSVDGATWTGPYPLHLVSDSGVILASSSEKSWGANGLVAALHGFIAVGGTGETPGETLWWQSANGRDWRALLYWPPLGPTTCTGEGCGMQPNGTLVGDGHRMVAVRGGADPGVWTSTDGLSWQRLPVSGDIPIEDATGAVLMPGGVLLSDRTTTWFGEAGGR